MQSPELADTLPSSSRLTLGPFRVGAQIGRGGMGRVFAAEHVGTGLPAAVKVLDARALRGSHREAFRHEVALTAGLDHPAIVQVYDFGEIPNTADPTGDGPSPGAPYLVMAYADRGSLADAEAHLDWPSTASVLFAVLDGLAHAHARGCVHCDLKPENVLLATTEGGVTPWIADFGIAHTFREGARTATAGTPAFMAPEQFSMPRDIGPWTDVYALGCVAWQLVCHGLPYSARSPAGWAIAHTHGERAVPTPALVGVPQAFADWLDRMLARDWRARFRTAAAAAAALARMVEPGAPVVIPDVDPRLVTTAPMPMGGEHDTTTLRTLDWIALPGDAVAEAGVGEQFVPTPPADWRRSTPAHPRLMGAGRALFGLRVPPLVGRVAERDRLWDALRAVHATGAPRVVVLRGAAGTGKSRLAQWLVERADEVGGGLRVDLRHGPEPGPDDGVRGALGRLIAPQGTDADLERARRLRGGAAVEAIDGVVVRLCRDEPGAPLSAERRHDLVARFVAAVAAPRPPVIWLDDAQWGLDAVQQVAHLLAHGICALVVVTVRGDLLAERPAEAAALAALDRDARVSTIDLAPLDRGALAELVEETLPLAPEVVAHVVARTEGHPLFAVQLVGEWLARGALTSGEHGFVVEAGALDALPGDVHGLWASRLDALVARLGEGAQAAIELGAALGARVERGAWRAACRVAGIEVPDGTIAQAGRAGLVAAVPGGWRFAHGMLRESTLRLAAEAGRLSAHHHACAVALAATTSTSPTDAARVADHFVAAGALAAALEPLRAAAWLHIDRMDRDPVRPLIARHDTLLDRLGARADDPRRGEGLVLRAYLAFADADLSGARACFDAARPIVERNQLGAAIGRLLRLRGMIARQEGDLDIAWRALTSAERQCLDVGLTAEAGKAALGRVNISRARGDVAGCRAAIDAAEAHFVGDGFWSTAARIERVRLLMWTGRLDEADTLVMQIGDDARRAGDEPNESRAWHTGAIVARMRRDHAAARVRLAHADALYARTGNINRHIINAETALLAVLRGAYAEAARDARAVLARLADTMWAASQPVLRLVIAVDAVAQGAGAEADAQIAAFDERLNRSTMEPGTADGVVICAEALAALGDAERAGRAAALAASLYRALGVEAPGGS